MIDNHAHDTSDGLIAKGINMQLPDDAKFVVGFEITPTLYVAVEDIQASIPMRGGVEVTIKGCVCRRTRKPTNMCCHS